MIENNQNTKTRNLEFKEVNSQKLFSDGTDFWVGVGIGAGIVGAAAALT